MKKIIMAVVVPIAIVLFVLSAFAGTREEADEYFQKGVYLYKASDYHGALNSWEKALVIYKEIGDRDNEVATLISIVRAYRKLDEYDTALSYYNKVLSYDDEVLKVKIETVDRKGEEDTLIKIGDAHSEVARYEKAIPCYKKALKIAKEIEDRKGEGIALARIGATYGTLAPNEKVLSNDALLYDKLALKIFREIEDAKGEADTLTNIGCVFVNLHQYEKALEYLDPALKIYIEIGDKAGESVCRNRIGWGSYIPLGKYQDAIDCFKKELECEKAIGDKGSQFLTLTGLGVVYRMLGMYNEVIPNLEEALEIEREIGNSYSEGYTLSDLGDIYFVLGDLDNALKNYKESLNVRRRPKEESKIDRPGEALTLVSIGRVYVRKGKYDKGRSYLEEALSLDISPGDKFSQRTFRSGVGWLYYGLKSYESAIAYFEEALKLNEELDDVPGMFTISWGFARSYKGCNEIDHAVTYYEKAIDKLETIRGGLKSEEFKTSFFGKETDVYMELIEILIEQGRYEEAFDYMERSRSRTFLDLLASGSFVAGKSIDKEVLEKDLKYQKRISALKAEFMKSTKSTDLKEEIEKLEDEYIDFIKYVNSKNPELASLVSVNPLTLKDVQRLLDAKTTLIEYFSTKYKTFAFVVTKTGLKVYPISISQADLTAKVNSILIPNISNRTRRADSVIDPKILGGESSTAEIMRNRARFKKECIAFYDLIFKPFAGDIKTENLIIVPYGALHKVPFAALSDGQNYLIDNYAISILPSASVLSYLKGKGKSNNGRLIAFANPDTKAISLKFAEEEVKNIKGLLGENNVEVYPGPEATETVLKGVSGRYDIVHLACHGEFNDRKPILSCLLLTEDNTNDGYLRLNEIFGLDLTEANLVVLSACETALSEVGGGDDLVGLSRGLIYAGAGSIVASLWNVNDRSTSILMTEFYKNWKEGMGKAEALRMAQIKLKSKEEYYHPYYWAAFELIGDGN